MLLNIADFFSPCIREVEKVISEEYLPQYKKIISASLLKNIIYGSESVVVTKKMEKATILESLIEARRFTEISNKRICVSVF